MPPSFQAQVIIHELAHIHLGLHLEEEEPDVTDFTTNCWNPFG